MDAGKRMEVQEAADVKEFLENLNGQEALADSFSYSLVLVRPSKGEKWVLHLGVFDFGRSDDLQEAGSHTYHELRLIRGRGSVADGVALLKGLIDGAKVELEPHGTFPFVGRISTDWHSSRSMLSSEGPLSLSGWPTMVLVAELSSQKYNPPLGPFVNAKEPPFSSLPDAAGAWLKMSTDNYRVSNARGTLLFRCPDYRGRFREFRFGASRMSLKAESPLGLADLIVKVVIDSPEGIRRETLHLEDGSASIGLPKSTRRASAYLIHVPSNTYVDQRTLNVSTAALTINDISTIEITEDLVEGLMARGENQWLEFKRELVDDSVLETVVAFANGEGGRLIIGVDDNGKAQGWHDEKGVQRIEGIVRGRVDPVPPISVNTINLHGKPLAIVTVPPGKNRPYILRERGPLIRSGSTDRAPTRGELDLLYSKNQGGPV